MCPSAGAKTAARRPQARWLSDSSGSGRSGKPNVPVFVRYVASYQAEASRASFGRSSGGTPPSRSPTRPVTSPVSGGSSKRRRC